MSTGKNGARAANESLAVKRFRFARRAGLQYGGARDVYTVAGYPLENQLDFDHYWDRYIRQDIAGRIVDMPAETTWRTPPEVIEDGRQDGTEFTRAFAALAKRLRLWHYFERADRLAGVGRYGILLIGVRGEGDDAALSSPMPQLTGPGDVLYVTPYKEADARVNTWVTNHRDPRFGQPETYQVRLSSGVPGFDAPDAVVHWSRVIHIAEDLLDDEVYGQPRLKRVLNRLIDLEKITAATGEAFWQLATRILSGEVDPNAKMSEEDRDALGEALEEMVHDLRRQIVASGLKLSWLGGDTPDPSSAADLCMTLIAAAAGIPKRMLFGSETGERASTEDQKTWLGHINERQEAYAEPVILRAFVDRMTEHGGLPKPETGEYIVVWPTLFQESEKDIAEANRARAETAKALTPVGGDPMQLVEIDAERNVWLRPTGERGELTPDELEPLDVAPQPVAEDEPEPQVEAA